ncbi:PfkB family carbohydrate kinase [Agromyces aurantiacus]|uniref:PfkB family carbohydrate kinase n=1 Tax=Agromyces aurantiacus TaxID=165814 RepID=A0ABV9R5U7_9MICO|nr:PfkB family carbohydrate kinase [Agromyces aurantiacus]MBM7503539.1 fructokinase [Agromyces aurantiacus]
MTSSTPRTARIAVIGDALIDELRDPSGSREFVGGAALNVAVGLALLGQHATLIAMLGDDEPADRIRTFLHEFGVRLIESPSALGTSRAVSDRSEGGEPRYEFNEAARHRRIEFGGDVRSAIDEADLVVVSCYPFDDDGQVDALLDAVGDSERRLIVDGNPRAGMLRDRARFLANFERAAARSLLVKAGDEDADLLAGEALDDFVGRFRGDPHPIVLSTAGRDGATIIDGEASLHADIVDLPGPVIDTMGAGDATLSAVVRRLARDGVPGTAVEWASVLDEAMGIAAATVRHDGALLRSPGTAEIVPS